MNKKMFPTLFLMTMVFFCCTETNKKSSGHPLIFAAFAENQEQAQHAFVLAESVRTYAGRFKDAPIWVYMPDELAADAAIQDKFASLNADVRGSQAPAEALSFFFARKVFAAAESEAAAEGTTDVLVWMDEDTVVMNEPKDFILDEGISFGYRPVMHNRSGSLYSEAPDEFWSRVYEKLALSEDTFFPVVTPGDQQTIRPYFNAGLLVVRPEQGVLRRWPDSFRLLYQDPVLKDMCQKDIDKRIFLHQAALVGAVLNSLKKEEMVEFSGNINYPLFFHVNYTATETFDSIEGIITLRYDILFRNPPADWDKKLKGPADRVTWLKERFGKK